MQHRKYNLLIISTLLTKPDPARDKPKSRCKATLSRSTVHSGPRNFLCGYSPIVPNNASDYYDKGLRPVYVLLHNLLLHLVFLKLRMSSKLSVKFYSRFRMSLCG